MDHAEDLQELNNRAGMCLHHFHGIFFCFVYIFLNSFLFTFAAGEVVIRQALGELDVWEIDAKFSFIEHQARFEFVDIPFSLLFVYTFTVVISCLFTFFQHWRTSTSYQGLERCLEQSG